MLAIAGGSLWQMTQIKQQLDEIVLVHNAKTKLIATMRHSNRERIISLQRMLILDDPFAIDDQAIYNMSLANQFITARRELENMITNDSEQQLLQNLRQKTMQAAPLNDAVRDTIWGNEDVKLAAQIMINDVIPAQDAIYDVFAKLTEFYESESKAAVKIATEEYQTAFRDTLVLLFFAVTLSIFIALFIIRHSSRSKRELTQHRDHLEQLVTERTEKLQQEINERKQIQQQLSFQASHDPLTGLVNRHELEKRIQQTIDDASNSNQEHCLCFLDLDQFKIVNDTCGHMAGDELLKQLVQHLLPNIRRNDTFARLGGDEFGILLQHCVLAKGNMIANSIRLAVEDFRFLWEDQIFAIGVSIGVVKIDRNTPSLAIAMSNVDAACYMAKEQGRNRVHIHDTGDDKISQRKGEMRWTSRLQQALDNNHFELYYQPIVNIQGQSDNSLHLEILLRLRDDDDNIIPPGAFLPAAERYGLLASIDRWVVNQAMAWLGSNQRQMKDSQIAINLAGETLSDPNFMGFVLDTLEKYSIAPQSIVFEITETSAIKNLQHARHFIKTLKAIGCMFSLDDFGSGLSSFSYLKNLPIDYLKIDGSFVKDILNDTTDEAMVNAINEVAHSMGKQTIAEFVENDLICKRLEQLGIDYAQGYGIATPQPLSEFKQNNTPINRIASL